MLAAARTRRYIRRMIRTVRAGGDPPWLLDSRMATGLPSTTTTAAAEVPGTPAKTLSLGSWLSFSAAHGVVAVLLLLTGLRGLYRCGQVLGTVEWLINRRRRRRFARALARVVESQPSAAERRRATLRYFQRTRCDKLFYLIFDRIPREQAEQLLTIDSKSLLDEALADGRGTYIAMSHHGAHHVGAMLMALQGYKIAGVRDRNEGGLRRYVQGRFDRCYPDFRRMRVLFSDSYPRDIFRCFREGYLVGSAMDVARLPTERQKAEEVTIFGEKRLFLSGPLRVAIRCGAPVVQAFVVSEPGFCYRVHIVDRLIDPDSVDDEGAAVSEALQTYAANVEQYLRADPSAISRI